MPISGVLEQLLKYWQELPRESGAMIPARASLQPIELHELLPRISLMKRRDRYDLQVSMIGTGTPTLWQTPMAGMNAFDLTSPDMRENTARLYEAVLDQPSGVHMLESVFHRRGRDVQIASLYLPLADRDGKSVYIIGCSVYRKKGAYGRINDRLLPDHQKVSSIEFIDLGYGKPTIQFDRPERREPHPGVGTRWWDKFMPTKPRPSGNTWLDA